MNLQVLLRYVDTGTNLLKASLTMENNVYLIFKRRYHKTVNGIQICRKKTNKTNISNIANKDVGQRSVSLLYMYWFFKEGSNGFYVAYIVTYLKRIRFIPSTWMVFQSLTL